MDFMAFFCSLTLLGLLIMPNVAEGATTAELDKMIKVERVLDYVLDTAPITDLDIEAALAYGNKAYDAWPGGCSCVAKQLDNGTMLLGRNMDFPLTERPVYIVRTNLKGMHPTIGLAYVTWDGPAYADALERGIPKPFHDLLPFMSEDTMNDQGLYIETHVRISELSSTGEPLFASSGTNPTADLRLPAGALPFYLAATCSTVEEAVPMARSINLYSMQLGTNRYEFAWMLADSAGNYGVLEMAQNELSWLPQKQGHTNFYLTEKFAHKAQFGYGQGRLDTLLHGRNAVKNKQDMLRLMNKVRYSQAYFPQTAAFDVRSEYAGEKSDWTTDYVLQEKHRDEVMDEIRRESADFQSYSIAERRARGGLFAQTIYTLTVDCNKREILAQFFEDNTQQTTIGFR